jgi:hypothetical protein
VLGSIQPDETWYSIVQYAAGPSALHLAALCFTLMVINFMILTSSSASVPLPPNDTVTSLLSVQPVIPSRMPPSIDAYKVKPPEPFF